MLKMETRGPHKATLSDALSVVLQHPAVAANQQNICRLVQVCKACRTAVQQSTACITEVIFGPKLPYENQTPADIADWAAKFALFGHWLSTYAGTVRSISLEPPECKLNSGAYRSLLIHAEHVMGLSLRSIAALQQHSSSQTGASKRMAAASEIAAVLPRPLGPQSFSCWHMFASPLVVSALPVATLTQLQVFSSEPDAMHLQEAIGNLSNLRSLHLECERLLGSNSHCWPDSYLSSISKLSQLTSLYLHPLQSPNALALLPQQLIELDLYPVPDESLTRPGQPTAASVVLSHLTQLQQLRLKYSRPLSDSRLPQQLRALYVNSCHYNEDPATAALHITSLQQLQLLHIDGSYDSPEELISLCQMHKLEKLTLEYSDDSIAAAAAATWPQLKQLAGLHLDLSCTAVQLATILEAIGSCTRLTSLSYAICYDVTYDEDEPVVHQAAYNRLRHTCQAFRSLTNLRELRILGGAWVPPFFDGNATDFLHLSALTGLTLLEVMVGWAHLEDDAVMIAVLLKLTQLQDLTLPLLNSTGPFPVIGELKGLTSLNLTGMSSDNGEDGVQDVQRQGLKYLTGLKKLRVLDGFEDCDAEVLEKFWSDLRGNA